MDHISLFICSALLIQVIKNKTESQRYFKIAGWGCLVSALVIEMTNVPKLGIIGNSFRALGILLLVLMSIMYWRHQFTINQE